LSAREKLSSLLFCSNAFLGSFRSPFLTIFFDSGVNLVRNLGVVNPVAEIFDSSRCVLQYIREFFRLVLVPAMIVKLCLKHCRWREPIYLFTDRFSVFNCNYFTIVSVSGNATVIFNLL